MNYLENTLYATEALFALITAETAELTRQGVALEEQKARVQYLCRRYELVESSDDCSDTQLLVAGAQAHQARDEYIEAQNEFNRLQSLIADRDFARRTLAGSVLQIAKQGLALAWGRYDSAPQLRKFGNVSIAQVIWEGRNQSAHFESGPNFDGVIRVFDELRRTGHIDFDVAHKPFENRALTVLKVLGWSDHKSYQRDMTELLHKRT